MVTLMLKPGQQKYVLFRRHYCNTDFETNMSQNGLFSVCGIFTKSILK